MLQLNVNRCGVPLRHCLFTLVAVCSPSTTSGQPGTSVTHVIGLRGDSAPDGNGSFYSFSVPSINDSGNVAFLTWFGKDDQFGNTDFGAYRADGNQLIPIARTSQPLAGGGASFLFEFDNSIQINGAPALNALNQVSLVGRFSGQSGMSTPAIIRTDGLSTQRMVQKGDTVPNGGQFNEHYNSTVALNSLGTIAFAAGNLRNTSDGANNDSGIYLSDGTNILEIAREGNLSPDGTFTFAEPRAISLNNFGQVAFRTDVHGGGVAGFRGDGTSNVQIARSGQFAPNGNGKYEFITFKDLNDLGQVLFSSSLVATAGGLNDNVGLYRGDGNDTVEIARRGQPTGGVGSFQEFFQESLNSKGQVLFSAGIQSQVPLDRGIFRYEGGSIRTIARKSDSAPRSGKFDHFNLFAFNDLGQVAFHAELSNTTQGSLNDTGIFFYDDSIGLVDVAREGDLMFGSRIVELSLSASLGLLGDERRGLNNKGQIAFRFVLADQRQGIAIWSLVPEPVNLFVFASGAIAMACCYRQRKEPSRRLSRD